MLSRFKLARPVFLLGLFLLPLLCFSQDYNGGFENLHPSGAPVGWARNDKSATAVTAGAFAGEKAIKAWINDFYLVGIWNNYSPEAVSRDFPGATADKTPANLSGIYWYDGHKSECETALVTVFAGTQGANGVYDTLAYTQEELFLNKEFEPFSFEIGAKSSQTPDFVSIQIEPRGKCYYRSTGKCCYLTMDELRFDQDIEKVEATVKAKKSSWVKSDIEAVRVNPDNVRRTKKERRLRRKKMKKLRKKRKGKGRTGPFYKKVKQPEGDPALSEPVPVEIQKEIDRINQYQKEEQEKVQPDAEEVPMPSEMEIKFPSPEVTPDTLEEMDNEPGISDDVLDELKMSEEEIDDPEMLKEGFEGDDVSEEGSSEDDY